MKLTKLSGVLILTAVTLSGCNTVQTASDVLPYPRAQVKEAVINAMSVYDYDVYGVTKTRISGDENNKYAMFNAAASPRVHVDMLKVDDDNTKVRIEFTKSKEILINTTDKSTHSKMMATIKKYLAKHFGGEASLSTTKTTRSDEWE